MTTTPTGIPIAHCPECGHQHPATRRHCPACGLAHLFGCGRPRPEETAR